MNGFPSSRNCDCHLVLSHPNQRHDAAQSRAQKREDGATTNLFLFFSLISFLSFSNISSFIAFYLFLPFSCWVHFSLSLSFSIDFFLYFCFLPSMSFVNHIHFREFFFPFFFISTHLWCRENTYDINKDKKKTDEKCVAGN